MAFPVGQTGRVGTYIQIVLIPRVGASCPGYYITGGGFWVRVGSKGFSTKEQLEPTGWNPLNTECAEGRFIKPHEFHLLSMLIVAYGDRKENIEIGGDTMDTKIEKAITKLAERMQPGGMTPEEQEAYAQFLEIASKMPAEALRDLTRRMEFAVSVMEIQKAG